MTEDWMIGEVSGVRGVLHVVVTTADGIVTARSPQTTREDAERLGAACAGLYSIGLSISSEFKSEFSSGSGDTRQVMIDLDGGFLFVRRAADGSRLAVVTDSTVEPAVIGQQMARQVLKIGSNLAATPRHAQSSPAT
jgi:predicted regulator of Ras-like GTPase activity (Roadblock/LC7/MglB family)